MERFKDGKPFDTYRMNIIQNGKIVDSYKVKFDGANIDGSDIEQGTELNAEKFNQMIDEVDNTIKTKSNKHVKLGLITGIDGLKVIIEDK